MLNLKAKIAYIILGGGLLALFSTSLCLAAPIIDRVEVTSISDNSMIVTFRTTNETSTAEVFVGLAEVPSTSTWNTTEASNYHYAEITGLYPGLTYQFQIKCHSATSGATSSTATETFTTLSQPSGNYLFSFAMLADINYADGKANSSGVRGAPYTQCATTLASAVTEINTHNPSFTVILGDNIDASYVSTVGAQVESAIKPRLDSLTKASDINYKYFPVAGNYDKLALYSGLTPGGDATSNWLNKNLGLLYPPVTAETYTTSSCANYSIDYKDYHFVFLDSVKWDTTRTGSADAAWLSNDLNSNSTKKTFVFLHYPAMNITAEGMMITLPDISWGGYTIPWQIDNYDAFQSIINTHKSHVAGVYMGHIYDAFKVMKHSSSVPYVRIPALVQFPIGYTIVKVYTNGFTQTFYKVKENNISETARGLISAESTGVENSVVEQLWLGANSARNFTHTYSYASGTIPTVQYTVPSSGETSIPIDQPLIIKFSKTMTTEVATNWVSISPTATYSVGLDSSQTILTVTPSSDLTESTLYTVNVTTNCTDANGIAMATAEVFTFTTTTAGFSPTLSATFENLTYDLTTNITPTLTGIATADPTGVATVEYKVDNGAWIAATPLDGAFNSTTEAFVVSVSSALARGRHLLYSRVFDFAGNSYTDPYAFYVVSNKPWMDVTIDGNEINPGDPIASTPSIEATIVAANGLDTSSMLLNFDDITVISAGFTIVTVEAPARYNVYYTLPTSLALTSGPHNIKLNATDLTGNVNTWEGIALTVQTSGTVQVQGFPLNYPNPFTAATGTQIGYSLTKDANIQLTIYDLMGTQLVRTDYSAGSTGGKIGYNKVTWNGKTDSGATCGFGIYIYLLVSDGQIIGKGKMTLLEQ